MQTSPTKDMIRIRCVMWTRMNSTVFIFAATLFQTAGTMGAHLTFLHAAGARKALSPSPQPSPQRRGVITVRHGRMDASSFSRRRDAFPPLPEGEGRVRGHAHTPSP